MLKIMGRITVVLLGIIVVAILAGQAGLWRGTAPDDLGVKAGRLKPPSATANSVSSQTSLYPDHPQKVYASIAPFTYTGDGKAAMQRLGAVLKAQERTEVIRQDPDYIYAQCTTRLMQYTDDVEFWLDEANNVIQVRSASRLGAEDMGVNRERIEAIRAQFLKN
jgi:uncharacterized protein (DUF1499 family)